MPIAALPSPPASGAVRPGAVSKFGVGPPPCLLRIYFCENHPCNLRGLLLMLYSHLVRTVMKARSFERALAQEYQAATPAALDLCMRELRRVGLVPVGGRGPNAPDLNFENVAAILIGLACSSIASQSGDKAKAYSKFVDPKNPKGPTLIQTMAALFADQQHAADFDEIRFCRTRPRVEFVQQDGGRITYHPPGTDLPGNPNKYNRGFAREEYVYGSALLEQIAIDFEFGEDID